MGQIKISNAVDIYRTFSENDVLITISGILPDGDLIAYQKDERTSYANGVPVLAVSGADLIPRVLAITALTARTTELVELVEGKKSHNPQRNGTFNVSLLKQGRKCLADNSLKVITISEIYPQMPIKMGKTEFSFDLIKCEWMEESAKIEGDFITFKGAKIAVAEVVAHFTKYCEEQTAKL